MARWRLPLLLTVLVGLPICAWWASDRASPATRLSEFGHLVLCAALFVCVLGLVVALIVLWRSLRRPMLWFGSVGCIALLWLVIVGLMNHPPDHRRYDPETLKVIKAGMAIEEVEEVLGESLTGIVFDRGNPDRSYLIITTRHHSISRLGVGKEWAVAEETFLVRFDENGRVLSTEKGGHTFRDESLFERSRRRLSTTLGL